MNMGATRFTAAIQHNRKSTTRSCVLLPVTLPRAPRDDIMNPRPSLPHKSCDVLKVFPAAAMPAWDDMSFVSRVLHQVYRFTSLSFCRRSAPLRWLYDAKNIRKIRRTFHIRLPPPAA